MADAAFLPVKLYGSSISYFTGKLENYFRVKGIPYQLQALAAGRTRAQVQQNTGSTQMPAVELADGRWLSDSTPVIQWFEAELALPAVIPQAPLLRFFSLLLEDYADEWLWRPAMHYRWYYTPGARFASTHLASEIGRDVPLPDFILRRLLIRRQRGGYTVGDGVTPDQVPGVEAIFLRTLEQLEAIFRRRPFLLGDRPSLADIGFSGPFFRHFTLDPVPAEIIRQRAPAVWEWSARLWNSRLVNAEGGLLEEIPADWGPILDQVGRQYLPYLCANVEAVAAGRRRFDVEVDGVRYRRARWSRYRVWCLQQLRRQFDALPEGERQTARALLERHGCWEPLWRHRELPLAPGFCERLPFHVDAKMIEVYG
jgi:glutathione S-transferase